MRKTTLILVCLVVALSACAYVGPAGTGGSSPGSGDGSKDDPISATPGAPVPPVGDGATREEPDPTVVDAHPVQVDHYAIGADGRTVIAYWWGGNTGCFGMKEITVAYRDGTPTITVQEGWRADHAGQACTMEAVLKSAVVTLDRPILADAAGGDVAPGEPELPTGATAVEPRNGVVDPLQHSISGYALSGDGLTLSAYYVGGVETCYGLAEASADRTADWPVTVSIREGALPDVEGPCIDIGVSKVATITLDQALIVAAGPDY